MILEISLNLDLNAGYKWYGFFKILLKKNFKFISNRKDYIVAFNLGFMVLLIEVDFILKKKSRKRDILVICDTGYIKIIFILLIKAIAFYIQAFII